MNRNFLRGNGGSRALAALLLLCLLFVLPSCGEVSEASSAKHGEPGGTTGVVPVNPSMESTSAEKNKSEAKKPEGTTIKARLPKDVLSKDEIARPQKPRDWNEPSGESSYISASGSSSAGNIPNVRPFNFGRDPGGPKDKTLYLDIPVLGLANVPVYNSSSEEKLMESTIHVPATGFPWQKGANVYIAGHRLGYPNTGSFRIFYELDEVSKGDEIVLHDSAGGNYHYVVTKTEIVDGDNIEVMNAEKGKSLVTLQTCTLPHYHDRVIVQGKLVEKST